MVVGESGVVEIGATEVTGVEAEREEEEEDIEARICSRHSVSE